MKTVFKCLGLAGIFLGVILGGCGSDGAASATDIREEVELREPRENVVGTDVVTLRNLYKANVYEGAVCPYVEEYSFDTYRSFDSYGAFLGDMVQKGDVLVYGDREALTKEIRALQEQLDDLREEFEKFREKAEPKMYERQNQLRQIQEILYHLERWKPGTWAADGHIWEASDEAYDVWRQEQSKWQDEYILTKYYAQIAEEELRRKEELYLLDYGYYSEVLADLRRQERDQVMTSQISGVVVAGGRYARGDGIRENATVAAVADMGQKFLRCSLIPWRQLTDSVDTFALIGGRRYSVVHKENSDGRTSFFLEDEADPVPIGSYAALVLISDVRRQVLTVPNASLFTDGTEQFVYLEENGATVSKQVQTGMSDGVYTEILSGLEEGDRVVSAAPAVGSRTAVLERGAFEIPYIDLGRTIFPMVETVRNTVENGSVIFQRSRVRERQWVSKGDVLLSVKVEIDDIALAAKENSLRRARERLADLEARAKDADEDAYKDAIAQSKERILEQEEEIAQIKADAAVTEICAPVSGFVSFVSPLTAGDVVAPGARVCEIGKDAPHYLALESSDDGALNYGDVLTLRCTDAEGEEYAFEGKVLSMGKYGLKASLIERTTIVSLPEDIPPGVLSPTVRYGVSGATHRMEDVVLVPAEAVTVEEGQTYVNVLREDGQLVRTSFLSGGESKEYYWAVEGLAEGMKLCWE